MAFRSDVFAEKLRSFMDKQGLSQGSLAAEVRRLYTLKIDQSEVSRMLKGERKRLAGNTLAVCEYAKIPLEDCMSKKDAASSSVLVGAVSEVWDGTREGETALAGVIKALGKLNRTGRTTARRASN